MRIHDPMRTYNHARMNGSSADKNETARAVGALVAGEAR
jgi:hypothetical protein